MIKSPGLNLTIRALDDALGAEVLLDQHMAFIRTENECRCGK
jgi:hypothetical protein